MVIALAGFAMLSGKPNTTPTQHPTTGRGGSAPLANDAAKMSEDKTENEDFSETQRPWERPGQVAQNPDEKPPEKKDIGFEQVSKTS